MKKIWKILAIIVIVITIVVVADIIYCKTAKVEPYDLFLTKEDSNETIKTSKGGYSWKEKGILRDINIVVDSIGPSSFYYTKTLKTNIGDKIYFDDYDWTSVSASIILHNDRKEIAKVPIESNLEGNFIVIPEMADGEYIVQINLKSDNGEVWYSTKIDISK